MSKVLIPLVFLITLLILTPGSSKMLVQTQRPDSLPFLTSATDSAQVQNAIPSSSSADQLIDPDLQSDLQKFNYPNSKIVSSSSDYLVLESTDSPAEITNWYKGQIQALGIQTTSFIETNTNGNILNKLAGSNEGLEIEVEINKRNSQKEVKIELNVIN